MGGGPQNPPKLLRGTLTAPLTVPNPREVFEPLVAGRLFRLERIVSTGQTTAAGEWYDQSDDEWVVLLSGSATLTFSDPEEQIDLTPGDWVLIPARRRHRVDRTAPDRETVWLALHYRP